MVGDRTCVGTTLPLSHSPSNLALHDALLVVLQCAASQRNREGVQEIWAALEQSCDVSIIY